MAGLIRLGLREIISIVMVVIAVILLGHMVVEYLGFGFSDIVVE